MPTYEYRCNECEHLFEEFQSITAKPLRKCPACGKHKLERLIGTGAGIIFKGSGFYETDYRSDSYRKGAEKEKSSGKAGGESGGGDGAGKKDKGETKSETKSGGGSDSSGGGAKSCGPGCGCGS